MPVNVTVRPAGSEVGLGLRTVVEPEHPLDYAVQFVRQMNRPSAPPIRASFVLEAFEVNVEGSVELSNGA